MTSKKNEKKTASNRTVVKHYYVNVDNGEGYYAVVNSICGGNIIEVTTHTNETKQAMIPGRMRKGRGRNWINKGNIILINKDYEVMEIIRDDDKRSRDAKLKLKINTDDVFDDVVDDEIEDIKQNKKELEKKRDKLYKQERNFTDDTILKKDTQDINNNKSFNIDDI